MQLRWRWGPLRLVNPRVVALAHRRGLAVHAWTVDDSDDMRACLRREFAKIACAARKIDDNILCGHRNSTDRRAPPGLV